MGEKKKKREIDKVLGAKGQRSRLEKGSVQERSRIFRQYMEETEFPLTENFRKEKNDY